MYKFFKILTILFIVSFATNSFIEKPQSKQITNTKLEAKNKSNKSKDFNLLISSNDYNAVVSLDTVSNDITITNLKNKNQDLSIIDNYIKLSDEDIAYLKENLEPLKEKFKNSNLFEKYNIINTLLNTYQTDLKESDIINLYLEYFS
ncbi:MAG: hypothetical protein RSB00_03970 [Bacilli bacterium]